MKDSIASFPYQWIIGLFGTILCIVAGGAMAYANVTNDIEHNCMTIEMVIEGMSDMQSGIKEIREGLIAEGIIQPT